MNAKTLYPATALAVISMLTQPASADSFFYRARNGVMAVTPASRPVIAITPVVLDVGGAPVTLSASGGTAPYLWSSSSLPAGLTLTQGGDLSSSAEGQWSTLPISVTDAAGRTSNADLNVRAVAPLAVSLAANATFAVPLGGSASISATGGVGPYSWSAVGMPANVSMAADGTVTASGSAATVTTSGVQATVTDSRGRSATVTFAVNVSAPTGTLYAFGLNQNYQSKPGTTQPVNAGPVPVNGWTDWSTTIAASGFTSCANRGSATYCWGYSGEGQAGYAGGNVGSPTSQGALWPFLSKSVARTATCYITGAGVAWCRGEESFGIRGDGYYKGGYALPGAVGGGQGATGWTSVAIGSGHGCGIRSGKAFCWGINTYGMLGNGTTTGSLTISPVDDGSSGWTEIAVGMIHSCGIKNGQMLCWGGNNSGQLGTGTVSDLSRATLIDGGSSGWTNLSAGAYFTCAMKNGVPQCWGNNYYGQLGNGVGMNASNRVPNPVGDGSSGWSSISAGSFHACGIKQGNLYCWGRNNYGQLGSNGTTDQTLPALVEGTGWKAVSTGGEHTLAVK